MNTGSSVRLTRYRDYEQILINLANIRGWEFSFADESIPVPSVFNSATYAPALLAAAGAELTAREIHCDLAYELNGEPNSLFGAKVSFPIERSSIQAQILRISTTAMIIDALPKQGNVIQLDHLQYVLGDDFAHFVRQSKEAS